MLGGQQPHWGHPSLDVGLAAARVTRQAGRARCRQDGRAVAPPTGSGERDAGRDDALDGGVVGQVEEQHRALQAAILLKVLLGEGRGWRCGGWAGGGGGATSQAAAEVLLALVGSWTGNHALYFTATQTLSV